MKIKNIFIFSKKTISLSILMLSPILSLGFSGVSHATTATYYTYYWCGDSTTANGPKMNTAANWSTANDCSTTSSNVPTNGDSVVFDAGLTPSSGNTLATDINNNIGSVAFGSVLFKGDVLSTATGAEGFKFSTSNASTFIVHGTMQSSMTSTNTAPTILFNDPVVFTSNSTVTADDGNTIEFNSVDGSAAGYSIDAAGFNLVFNGAGNIQNDAEIGGTGNITVNMATSSTGGVFTLKHNTTFAGAVIASSPIVEAGDYFQGATSLAISGDGMIIYTGTTDLTIAEPVTMGGNGPTLCEISINGAPKTATTCGPTANQTTTPHNITFTGNVTLTANTSFFVGNGSSTYGVTISGSSLTGSYKLDNRIGYLHLSATTNNSLTANGNYGPSLTGATGGVGVPSGSTPDTGFGVLTTPAAEGLIGAALIAESILIVKKKFSRN